MSAMAKTHSASYVLATEPASVHGSTSNPWKDGLDEIKLEIASLKVMIMSVQKEIRIIRGKAEEAPSVVRPAVSEVKTELVEPELEGTPGLQEVLNNDQTEVEPREKEQIEAGGRPGVDSRDCDGASEQIVSMAPQRQSTEELMSAAPPHSEVLFRVNPEYARRKAAGPVMAGSTAVTMPLWTPTPPPNPRKINPPPLRHRLPSLPPVPRPTNTFRVTPAQQAKRKHNFELIIEIPAKRFKPSCYPGLSTSSSIPIASSSCRTQEKSVEGATPAQKKRPQTHQAPQPLTRGIADTSFNVTLNQDLREVLVTRTFLRDHFGVNKTYSCSAPPQSMIDQHGYDHFAFVNSLTTPQAPPAPGKPGLVVHFGGRQWPMFNLYRVFVRVPHCLSPMWQYMGLYKPIKLPALTPIEIRNQTPAIKRSWAGAIRNLRWARPTLARIMLRKELNREPTKVEVNDRAAQFNEKLIELPSLEVITAELENGEEKFYPWKLVCEGYEENLQWEIAVTFPHYKRKARLASKA